MALSNNSQQLEAHLRWHKDLPSSQTLPVPWGLTVLRIAQSMSFNWEWTPFFWGHRFCAACQRLVGRQVGRDLTGSSMIICLFRVQCMWQLTAPHGLWGEVVSDFSNLSKSQNSPRIHNSLLVCVAGHLVELRFSFAIVEQRSLCKHIICGWSNII